MTDVDFAAGETHDDDFQAAADHVGRVITSDPKRVSDDDKLALYGLYKQSTQGDCSTSRPGLFEFAAKAKWNAWARLKGTPHADAMQQYVALVRRLDPSWGPSSTSTAAGSGRRTGAGGGMGPAVSTLAPSNDAGEQSKGPCTLHELAGQGDIGGLQLLLQHGAAVDAGNAEGATALHFAADRGQQAAVELLLQAGAAVGARDADGQTPLHYAALCGHPDVCRQLLKAGGDAGAQDDEGNTPKDLAPSEWDVWS